MNDVAEIIFKKAAELEEQEERQRTSCFCFTVPYKENPTSPCDFLGCIYTVRFTHVSRGSHGGGSRVTGGPGTGTVRLSFNKNGKPMLTLYLTIGRDGTCDALNTAIPGFVELIFVELQASYRTATERMSPEESLSDKNRVYMNYPVCAMVNITPHLTRLSSYFSMNSENDIRREVIGICKTMCFV